MYTGRGGGHFYTGPAAAAAVSMAPPAPVGL